MNIRAVLLGFCVSSALLLVPPRVRADVFYVSNYVSKTVQKVTADGAASTFAATASGPSGLAFDQAGNLFVNVNNTIVKYTLGGVGTTFGTASSTYTSGLAFDGSGNLYVAGFSAGTIERFSPAGARSTFASTGLSEPYALAFDRAGNLFVANDGVYAGGINGTITKITPGGATSVFATGFSDPQGLAFDGNGNLYVAETQVGSYNGEIERIAPDGTHSIFATLGNDIDPIGLAFDSKGALYAAVTNQNNNTYMIDKFTANGVASIFANVAGNPIDLAVTTDAGVPLTLPSPVPEPSAWKWLAAGASSFIVWSRRFKV